MPRMVNGDHADERASQGEADTTSLRVFVLNSRHCRAGVAPQRRVKVGPSGVAWNSREPLPFVPTEGVPFVLYLQVTGGRGLAFGRTP